MLPPFPADCRSALFGMGCFWGAERCFWRLSVYGTAVGYSGGHTPNPSYQEVCGGQTGHVEVVLIVYQLRLLDYETLLRCFWEQHDPTQGLRQGNDHGSQYRSAVYACEAGQEAAAHAGRARYQAALKAAGLGAVTTEIAPAGPFYYAETEHQQYLAKNPGGYCGLQGLGVPYPEPA